MNFIIPILAAVAAIAGIFVNALIIESDRSDWNDVVKKALAIGLVFGVAVGILNYFIMVKTIPINLVFAFAFFFSVAFWLGYGVFGANKNISIFSI